jgi:uncharacterized caspase-like protein
LKNYIVYLILALAFISNSIYAQDKTIRYALVIGNQSYQKAPLRNPLNDAKSIAENLMELNFEVTLLTDAGYEKLSLEIEEFYRNIRLNKDKKAIVLFYYAGHAIQISHRNYLVPLDVKFGDTKNFMAGLYDINKLLSSIPKQFGLQNIIILDACRDNPFEVQGSNDETDRFITDGLAPLRAPVGTLIAYSTEPGSVASDGKGKNGIYTKYLLHYIQEMISIEEVFKKVRKSVAKETGNRQIPWEHSSLLEDVFINPPKNRDLPTLISF